MIGPSAASALLCPKATELLVATPTSPASSSRRPSLTDADELVAAGAASHAAPLRPRVTHVAKAIRAPAMIRLALRALPPPCDMWMWNRAPGTYLSDLQDWWYRRESLLEP
mmetsp:Transcript_90600/g.163480  ORF Transcript_90600/g.163480 Transcript_90600/m.163480 type:complete len:111 (+) Transcript_90600:438-770(+)